MEAAYETFLNRPNRESYCRVQDLLIQDWDAAPRREDLYQLRGELHSRRFKAAIQRCERMSRCWLLSSRFHELSASVASASEDFDWEELELFQMDACLTGLLQTGDGSFESPFLTTYETDVQDILGALGRDSHAQHLVRRPTGCFDLITCTDGAELWFACRGLDAVHDRLSPMSAESLQMDSRQ